MYKIFIIKKGFKYWNLGVVHSQISCTDFKSSKKILWFFRNFLIFRNSFFVYEDFIIKKGFKYWNRGVVQSQIRYTDFKSSKKSLDFLHFFRIFRIFFFGEQPFAHQQNGHVSPCGRSASLPNQWLTELTTWRLTTEAKPKRKKPAAKKKKSNQPRVQSSPVAAITADAVATPTDAVWSPSEEPYVIFITDVIWLVQSAERAADPPSPPPKKKEAKIQSDRLSFFHKLCTHKLRLLPSSDWHFSQFK